MIHLKKIILLAGTVFLLAGCQQSFTAQYLLEHPEALKSEVERCEMTVSMSDSMTKHCEIVVKAAGQFMTLLNHQQFEPEQFGETVLLSEMKVSDLKEQYLQNKKKRRGSVFKNMSADEKIKFKHEYEAIRNNYHHQLNELKILLAVIGVNTPH